MKYLVTCAKAQSLHRRFLLEKQFPRHPSPPPLLMSAISLAGGKICNPLEINAQLPRSAVDASLRDMCSLAR